MKHLLTFGALCVSATLFACSSTQTTSSEGSLGAVPANGTTCQDKAGCCQAEKANSDAAMGAVGTKTCEGGSCAKTDANMGTVGTSECSGAKSSCHGAEAASDASMGAVGKSECTGAKSSCHGSGN